MIIQDKLEDGVWGCSKDSSPSAATRGPDSEDHKQPRGDPEPRAPGGDSDVSGPVPVQTQHREVQPQQWGGVRVWVKYENLTQ